MLQVIVPTTALLTGVALMLLGSGLLNSMLALRGSAMDFGDAKLGLIASDDLNPQKARVLLRLALLKQRTPAELQRLFVEY